MPTSDRPHGPADGPNGPSKCPTDPPSPDRFEVSSTGGHPGRLVRYAGCFPVATPEEIPLPQELLPVGVPAFEVSPGPHFSRPRPGFPTISRELSGDFVRRGRAPPGRRPSKQHDTGESFRVTHFATPAQASRISRHPRKRILRHPPMRPDASRFAPKSKCRTSVSKCRTSVSFRSRRQRHPHPGSVSKRASSPSPYGRCDPGSVAFDLSPSSNRPSGTSA